MILDLQNTLTGATGADGNPQPITATAISTNVLDTRNAAMPALVDEGLSGPELTLVVQTVQAFNNLTSLTITLESDSASSLASAPVVHYSKTILLAALVANTTLIRAQLPSDDYKRFVGLRYSVTGTNPSQGSLQAYLVATPQRAPLFPKSMSIDV